LQWRYSKRLCDTGMNCYESGGLRKPGSSIGSLPNSDIWTVRLASSIAEPAQTHVDDFVFQRPMTSRVRKKVLITK